MCKCLMQKQVFTGLIYTEFYTPCQHFRNLVSSWEVGKTTCVKQVVNKTRLTGGYTCALTYLFPADTGGGAPW